MSPVSRYAGRWGIPVLTTSAQVEGFRLKTEFPTLTRMLGSHTLLGEAVMHTVKSFGWKTVGFLYHNNPKNSGKGHSKCFFALSPVVVAVINRPNRTSKYGLPIKDFYERNSGANYYREALQTLAKSSRSKFTVREKSYA